MAEVLITLGIIGVIAAMALPMLIGDINDIRFRSQFFKSYSQIKQVLKNMIADGTSPLPDTSDKYYLKYKNYITFTEDCGDHYTANKNNIIKGCYDYSGNSPYVSLDGKTKANYLKFDDGQLILPDGSLLLFENPANSGLKGASGEDDAADVWIWVDLNNASNPPNRLGYDLFVFQITAANDELFPMGAPGTKFPDSSGYCDKNGSGRYNGMSCAYKMVKDRKNYYKWLRSTND